jgi:hypothetical protein
MTIAETLLQPLARVERFSKRLDARYSMSDARVVEVATGVTCVLILLTGPKEWYVSVCASALAATALIFPSLRTRPALWAFLGTAVGASAFINWESTDNHKYLLAYWCLAVTLSLTVDDQPGYLARCARLLIGVSFAIAVLWKLRSPDFVDGNFFRIQLLTDHRFVAVASWVGGMPVEVVRDRQALWSSLGTITDVSQFKGFDLEVPARLSTVAVAMTWWTLFIEVWIALAFLVPGRMWLGRFRDIPLLVFAISTYAVATVLGFGYLLLAMGLCQAHSARARAAYVAAFIVLFAFEIPVFALSGGNSGAAQSASFFATGDASNSDQSN